MRSLLILVAVIAVGFSEHVSYEGFKVYQLLPSTEEQLHYIKSLEDSEEYDFWSPIGDGVEYVDVMVNPRDQPSFALNLQRAGIEYKILIPDVGSTVQQQHLERLRSPKLRKGEISFEKYHTYAEIQDYLHKLDESSDSVSVEKIGESFEGRDLNVIKISKDPSANKPIIFIDGGIHAREWISPATVLYIVHQLVENPDADYLLDNVDWYIIPTLNPDGYAYTFSKERMWRKTRSPTSSSYCPGVDANRNFGHYWGGGGTSNSPCSEIYRGTKAFSEVETAALKNYIWEIKDRVKVYLSFHSYGNYIMYPWGYTSAYPEDAAELDALGKAAAASIRAVAGTRYTVGSVTNVLYVASGGSMDWTKGEAGIELSFTFELPGKNSGFLLPPRYILPVAEETWQGVLEFHKHIEKKYSNVY